MARQMPIMFQVKAYNQGQTIFREGQDGSFACIVNSGQVAVTKEVNGEPLTLATLGRGAVFGEMALVGLEKRTASVVALTYTEVVVVDRERLHKALESSNPLIAALVKGLVERLAATSSMVRKEMTPGDKMVALAMLIQAATEEMVPEKDGMVRYALGRVMEYNQAVLRFSSAEMEQFLTQLAGAKLLQIERLPKGRQLAFSQPAQLGRRARALAERLASQPDQPATQEAAPPETPPLGEGGVVDP